MNASSPLNALISGAAAHARPGEVEVGELVLLDVLLVVAGAEDDRALLDAELLDERLRARQVALGSRYSTSIFGSAA